MRRHFAMDYEKWRKEIEKRMVQDPYTMLFGASERRLRGLGFGKGWMGWMEDWGEGKGEKGMWFFLLFVGGVLTGV